MVTVTPTKRARIFSLKQQNLNNTEIAAKLGIHRTTVSRTLQKLGNKPDFYAKTPIPGRPRLLNDRDIRHAEIALSRGDV